VLNGGKGAGFTAESLAAGVDPALGSFKRSSPFMQQPVFNNYHWCVRGCLARVSMCPCVC
jgi:glycine dehydrogenase